MDELAAVSAAAAGAPAAKAKAKRRGKREVQLSRVTDAASKVERLEEQHAALNLAAQKSRRCDKKAELAAKAAAASLAVDAAKVTLKAAEDKERRDRPAGAGEGGGEAEAAGGEREDEGDERGGEEGVCDAPLELRPQ